MCHSDCSDRTTVSTCDGMYTSFGLQVPEFNISILRATDQDSRVSCDYYPGNRLYQSYKNNIIPSWAWSKL
jgi:hypothetical protein